MRVPVAFQLTPDIWIPINWKESEDMPSDCFAEYHYDLSGGYIDASKSIKPEVMDMVILHELRHCYFANMGYTDLLKAWQPELEESINEAFDFMMRGIIKINHESKRWKWKIIDV